VDPKSLSDILQTYDQQSQNLASGCREIRLAFLSSFSIQGLKETVYVKCADLGIKADITMGKYGQYAQDMLDESGPLHRHPPHLTFLLLDPQSILGDLIFDPLSMELQERRQWVTDRSGVIVSMTAQFAKKTGSKMVIHLLPAPYASPLGILDDKIPFGIKELVQHIHLEFQQTLGKDPNVFLFDSARLMTGRSARDLVDPKMYYFADYKIGLQNFPALASMYMDYIAPAAGVTRKGLVVDLDNTLWGGILGEDGPDGIHLGPTPEGRPYWELQKYILGLWRRGVVLAINSKNNEEDVLSVMKSHPYMVLKENHFSSWRINWSDKVENMVALSTDLKLGLDSLVFLDDDPMNRDFVQKKLPAVKVIDLPPDPARYLFSLAEQNEWNTLVLTSEDLNRGRMYQHEKMRKQGQSGASSLDDYLAGLNLFVTIMIHPEALVVRLAQLAQKTNQFNCTLRRHTENDLRAFLNSPDALVLAVRVEDKFGDYGITGLSIIKKEGSCWMLDTFLLSCRVLGRRVEDALLNWILLEALREGAHQLVCDFSPTLKNDVARDFLIARGFRAAPESAHPDRLALNVGTKNPSPLLPLQIRFSPT
jgi:FkbH-like protein